MLFEALDKQQGSEYAVGVVYARAPLRGKMHTLKLDLFLPHKDHRPASCLVWLRGGGFETGRYVPGQFQRLARWCAQEGIAVIAPDFRLGATAEDLEPTTRAALPDIAGMAAKDLDPSFYGPAALAAMEDVLCALVWLEENAKSFGLRKRPVLGGSEAGAFTAFSTVYTALTMGHEVPKVAGILSFSGGLAWPELFMRGRVPIFAVHNPLDPKIPISPIRRIAQADPNVELIEAMEHQTGSIKLWPEEGRAACHSRLLEYIKRWSAQAPLTP